MSKYKIEKADNPSPFKDIIASFWKEYLSETPAERFEWLMRGNPAGQTIWLLALLEETDELIGTLSLMPKELHWNGQTFRGAIMGDLMVHKNHRVFGPTLCLVKGATQLVSNHVLDFVYTIPNPDSLKIIERAGLKNKIALRDYIKPIKLDNYLSKYIPLNIAKLLSVMASPFLYLFSREAFSSTKGFFEVVTFVDDSFDDFWEVYFNSSKKVTRCYDSKYLRWRYLQNPLHPFQILIYRKKPEGPLSGYLIFNNNNNRMEIFDLVTLDEKDIFRIIKKAIKIARKHRSQAIYITIPPKGKLPMILKSFGFFNANVSMQVCWSSDSKLPFDSWEFFQGDRNI